MARTKILASGLVMTWVTVIVILIDRYSKLWAIENLSFHQPLSIFPFFDLTLAYNTGAAFSFLDSAAGWQNLFLGGLAIIVSVVILVWLSRISAKEVVKSIALSLILGGALSNLSDRFLYGHVIDLLSFHFSGWYFAIFNVADSAICVGAFLLACCWLVEKR